MRITANGARIEDTHTTAPSAVAVGLEQLRLTAPAGSSRLELDGDASSACFGGRVRVRTVEALVTSDDEHCFQGGALRIESPGTAARVSVTTAGGVELDLDGEGALDATLPSCRDLPGATCK